MRTLPWTVILVEAMLAAGCASGQPAPALPQTQTRKEPVMAETERNDFVTMRGKPLTLAGQAVRVGDAAPDFTAVANDLSEAKLSNYRGKTVLIAAVPSLDTSVCSLETRRFNEEASALGDDVVVLTLSMDLPFAQKRWCGAEGVKRVVTLSDHRTASFGLAYGVLIPELRLLARSVFVVAPDGRIAYAQLVREVTHEPDYAAALDAVRKARSGVPAR
jgi:thioredoxin-dependent peroxiredoxin